MVKRGRNAVIWAFSALTIVPACQRQAQVLQFTFTPLCKSHCKFTALLYTWNDEKILHPTWSYLPVTQNLEATCWYVVIVVAVQQTVITLFI